MKLLLYFLSAISVSAASWYVDYAAGNDSNAGTSTGAAFKRCPGDQQATGTALATTFSPGDTVFFKGGVTYTLTATNIGGGITAAIVIGWSGSAGNPITYDGNSSGGWGTGKAIVTDGHGTNKLSAFRANALRQYVDFKNFNMTEIGGSAALPPDLGSPVASNRGGGISYPLGARNCNVTDCDFSELGYYWNAKPMNDASIEGGGIGIVDARDVVITNCEFTRMGTPLYLETQVLTTNLTIKGCRIHDSVRWGIDFPTTIGSGASGAIMVTNCSFYNFGQFGSGTWTGYGEWPHVDGIFLRRDISGTRYSTNNDLTGINFAGNSFWDTNQLSANGTACIYLAGGTSANIYNNQFIHTIKSATIFSAGAAVSPTTPTTVRIYNNTFLENFQNNISVSPGAGVKNSVLDIRNNVFYDLRQGSGANVILYFTQSGIATNLTINYNIYKSFNTSGQWVVWTGVGAGGLSLLQSQGLEANGLATDPLFVDISYGSGYQCNSNNLHIVTSSPAKGAAETLTLFTTDKDGITRSVPWDMGAYEFVGGGGGVPTIPGSLTASAVGSDRVTLTWTASTDDVAVTGYDLYRSGAFQTTVGTTNTLITGLAPVTAYSYTVRAHDGDGNQSADSNTAAFTTRAAGIPTAAMLLRLR
jgi:hypothetical protein